MAVSTFDLLLPNIVEAVSGRNSLIRVLHVIRSEISRKIFYFSCLFNSKCVLLGSFIVVRIVLNITSLTSIRYCLVYLDVFQWL